MRPRWVEAETVNVYLLSRRTYTVTRSVMPYVRRVKGQGQFWLGNLMQIAYAREPDRLLAWACAASLLIMVVM